MEAMINDTYVSTGLVEVDGILMSHDEHARFVSDDGRVDAAALAVHRGSWSGKARVVGGHALDARRIEQTDGQGDTYARGTGAAAPDPMVGERSRVKVGRSAKGGRSVVAYRPGRARVMLAGHDDEIASVLDAARWELDHAEPTTRKARAAVRHARAALDRVADALDAGDRPGMHDLAVVTEWAYRDDDEFPDLDGGELWNHAEQTPAASDAWHACGILGGPVRSWDGAHVADRVWSDRDGSPTSVASLADREHDGSRKVPKLRDAGMRRAIRFVPRRSEVVCGIAAGRATGHAHTVECLPQHAPVQVGQFTFRLLNAPGEGERRFVGWIGVDRGPKSERRSAKRIAARRPALDVIPADDPDAIVEALRALEPGKAVMVGTVRVARGNGAGPSYRVGSGRGKVRNARNALTATRYVLDAAATM